MFDTSNVVSDRTVRPNIVNNLASGEINIEVHREDDRDVGESRLGFTSLLLVQTVFTRNWLRIAADAHQHIVF